MKPFALNVDPDTTVQSHQLEHQLDSCDPLACVLFSHAPSVEVYFALRTRLESSTETWLQEFISLDGLDSLLDSLGHMCGPKFNGFSDAILQIDCLSCIRAILNSKTGMTFLINSQNNVQKLLKGVDLVNTLPRKHVFEILSAVCVYNNLGYKKVMEAMEKYRREHHHVHKLSFIVNELKMAETIPHKTSLLTFINAIISSTPDKSQRCRIRAEFAGLGLFDVISFLQREETDEDLCVQLQGFHDKMHDDESTMNRELSMDCNCPHDLVDTIQSKVFGGPKMVCFVNILQDLLAMETIKKEKSDIIWKVLERHIHHIVHANDDIESHLFDDTESACFAFTTAVESDKLLPHCHCPMTNNHSLPKDTPDSQCQKHKILNRMSSTSSMKKDSSLKTSADSGFIGCDEKLSPTGCEMSDHMNMESKEQFTSHSKKPPHFPMKRITAKDSQSENGKSHENENVSHTFGANMNLDNVDNRQNMKHLSVYDNVTPVRNPPKDTEMKTPPKDSSPLNGLDIQCEILSRAEALGENNAFKSNVQNHTTYENLEKDKVFRNAVPEQGNTYIKTQVRHEENEEMSESNEIVLPTKVMRNLKWIKLDGSLIDEYPQAVWKKMKSENQKIKPNFSQMEEMFHEHYDEKRAETPLLSRETRLRMNLFLSRCDEEPTELVKKLVRVDGPGFPLPFMKHLSEIIPDADEVKHLKFYNGNLLELGQAEQFILHLSDIPDYEIVLTGQLQKAQFRVMASRLRMVLNSMLDSLRAILASEGLKEIFLLILKLGNFCNHGQYNGYASGFKLSSLPRLADVKSKEPGHTLVHYLTSCIEEQDSNLLNFLKDIPQLEKAASYSLATIKADFDKMNAEINSFVRQLANANPIIRNGFDSFLEEVKREFRSLQSQISQLKVQSKSLAAYFCESDSFELQASFKTLLGFYQELKLCQQEVKVIKVQKATAAKHTNMFSQQIQNKQFAFKFGQKAGASSSIMEEKRCIIDTLVTELHRGNFAPVMTIPLAKESQAQHTVSQQLPLASTLAKLPSIPPVMSAPCIVSTTPNRSTDNLMELSRISLMGTPMMNRPGIEMFEEEITITANKPITSSENDLLDNPDMKTQKRMKEPLLPMPKPLTKTATDQGKGHYRSRSDLADSININRKWIRYHDQLKFEKAPLAKPESSLTVATLNLEAGSSTRQLYPETEAMTLIRGPTLELPPSGSAENDLNKHGKKPEHRSTLGKMINKIARRVLKPRNTDVMDNNEVDENLLVAVRKNQKRETKMEKAYSLGRTAGLATIKRESEKENICEAEFGLNDQFDRQTKNPLRLSNRFKNKLIK